MVAWESGTHQVIKDLISLIWWITQHNEVQVRWMQVVLGRCVRVC